MTADELHPLAQTVLASRKIDDVEAFLNPEYGAALHDPYLFRQMKDFVDRLHQAIEKKERIVIFSDFDTDGIPAAAMFHDLFGELDYENFEIYIPKRDIEGFGLKTAQVEQFAASGTDLLITVDCGIRSNVAVKLAKSEGMDVVILDHHVAGQENPPADIIINPALAEETYPFKKLCGAGVVFKCLQALEADERFALPENFSKGQLGLAAIATISDMVPLVGENRALAQFGMRILRRTTRPGLKELFEKGRIQGRELTEVDIGFTLGAHINAASRLDQPLAALRMLTTRNHAEGKEYAHELNRLYRERKRRSDQLRDEIFAAAAAQADQAAIVVGSSEWKPALLGPVAHGLSDDYDRPVFLWGQADGSETKKGSARATRHNVVEMLAELDEALVPAFGGHEMAGGFELAGDPDELARALAAVADDHVVSDEVGGYDPVVATLADISWNLFRSLERLGPFGMGFAPPLFQISGVHIDEKRVFGAGGAHISLTFTDGEREQEGVCFFAPKSMKEIECGQKVTVVGAVEKSTFGFKKKLQFKIESITEA